MKKAIFFVLLCSASLSFYSCDNNSGTKDNHTHTDGSTHADHDTTKPAQQEFNVTDTIKKDTSIHTHEKGEKYSH